MVEIPHGDAGLAKAVVDRVIRQLPGGKRHRPLAVLDPCEALFLGCGDDLSVAYKRGGTVVKYGVNSQGMHGVPLRRRCRCRMARPLASPCHRGPISRTPRAPRSPAPRH